MQESQTQTPTTNRTVVTDNLPAVHRLSVAVGTDKIELIQESPTHDRTEDGDYDLSLTETTVSISLTERPVNQYSEFETQSESFNSTVASKSDSERFALVEIDPDGDIAFYPTHTPRSHDSLYPVHDDSVWGMRLDGVPGVLVSVTSRTDTCESYSKRKIRVTREAVDHVRDAGGRLVGVKWREASGGSRNNASWSTFEGIEAVEFVEADE